MAWLDNGALVRDESQGSYLARGLSILVASLAPRCLASWKHGQGRTWHRS